MHISDTKTNTVTTRVCLVNCDICFNVITKPKRKIIPMATVCVANSTVGRVYLCAWNGVAVKAGVQCGGKSVAF